MNFSLLFVLFFVFLQTAFSDDVCVLACQMVLYDCKYGCNDRACLQKCEKDFSQCWDRCKDY